MEILSKLCVSSHNRSSILTASHSLCGTLHLSKDTFQRRARSVVRAALKIVCGKKSRHFTTPSLVSLRNDVWETTAKIPYWWRSLPISWLCSWLVEANFSRGTTSQKHFPHLGSHTSSVWIFCSRCSDVIRGETSDVNCFIGLRWKGFTLSS